MRRELRPASPKRYDATGESTRRADRQQFAGGRGFDPGTVGWRAHGAGDLDRINGAVTATGDRILTEIACARSPLFTNVHLYSPNPGQKNYKGTESRSQESGGRMGIKVR